MVVVKRIRRTEEAKKDLDHKGVYSRHRFSCQKSFLYRRSERHSSRKRRRSRKGVASPFFFSVSSWFGWIGLNAQFAAKDEGKTKAKTTTKKVNRDKYTRKKHLKKARDAYREAFNLESEDQFEYNFALEWYKSK